MSKYNFQKAEAGPVQISNERRSKILCDSLIFERNSKIIKLIQRALEALDIYTQFKKGMLNQLLGWKQTS